MSQEFARLKRVVSRRLTWAALVTMEFAGPVDTDRGICANIVWELENLHPKLWGRLRRITAGHTLASSRVVASAWVHLDNLWPTWPKFSGYLSFPVPAPPSWGLDPDEVFEDGILPKWEGEYGELRRELLGHAIDTLQAQVSECEYPDNVAGEGMGWLNFLLKVNRVALKPSVGGRAYLCNAIDLLEEEFFSKRVEVGYCKRLRGLIKDEMGDRYTLATAVAARRGWPCGWSSFPRLQLGVRTSFLDIAILMEIFELEAKNAAV